MDLKETHRKHKFFFIALTLLNAIGFVAMNEGFDREQGIKINDSALSLNSLIAQSNTTLKGAMGGSGILIDVLFELTRNFNRFLCCTTLYKKDPSDSSLLIKQNKKKVILARIGIVLSALIFATISIATSNFLLPLTNSLILQSIINVAISFLFVMAIILISRIYRELVNDIQSNKNLLVGHRKRNRKLLLGVTIAISTIGALILKSYLETFILNPKLTSSKIIISALSFLIICAGASIILNILTKHFAKNKITKGLFKDYNQIIDKPSDQLTKTKDKKKALWKLAGYFILFFTISFSLGILQKFMKTSGVEFISKHFGKFTGNLFANLLTIFFFFSTIIAVQMENIIYKMISTYAFGDPEQNRQLIKLKTNEELKEIKNIKLLTYYSLILLAFITSSVPIVGMMAHFDLGVKLGVVDEFFRGYLGPPMIMICALITGALIAILTKLHKDIIEIETCFQSSETIRSDNLTTNVDKAGATEIVDCISIDDTQSFAEQYQP